MNSEFLGLTNDTKSANYSDMVTTSVRRFVREFSRFRKLAEAGEPIHLKSRRGANFVFTRATDKQKPPRRARKGLDPELYRDIDLDTPAAPPSDWEANR